MIPSIRSLAELIALSESRDKPEDHVDYKDLDSSTMDSGQRKRYIRSIDKNKVVLPFSKNISSQKSIFNKKSILKFVDRLDYNNQIQSSYDLTLLARQEKTINKEAA